MGCNWELFEFRLNLYQGARLSGDVVMGSGMAFSNVSVDTNENFEGSNDICDFRPAFLKIVANKLLHVTFPLKQQGSYDPSNYFDVLRRTANTSNNPVVYPAAILWVYRRDTQERDRPYNEPRILMERVEIDSVNFAQVEAGKTLFGATISEYVSDVFLRFKLARLAGQFK